MVIRKSELPPEIAAELRAIFEEASKQSAARKHPKIKDHIPLDRIRAEADQGSIHALRDYALTLLSLYSGLRRREIFDLRGSDVELLKGGLIVRYKRRGKYHRKEVARVDAEISTKQATDILNVSRPYLLGLLEETRPPSGESVRDSA